ncbi:MAG: hypothetical protein L6R42_001608 [Xanthoria sp. 1 TBL-2021]|nr:MAG: hypothetical protein L6R42_001608 [Xanthoria sp. 1 TBL-2021]
MGYVVLCMQWALQMRAKPFSSGLCLRSLGILILNGVAFLRDSTKPSSGYKSATLYRSLARTGSHDIMTDRQTGNGPAFGHLRLADYVVVIYCVLRILVWELPLFLVTFFLARTESSTSFVSALQYFLVRKTSQLLNPAGVRWLTRPGSEHVDPVLTSRRYRPYHGNIYHTIGRTGFVGSWVMQSSLQSPKPPASSDLTIFYLHGGGYISSQPAHYLLFLLRLGEAILEQGISVSIFALDYSLAPEHVFPTQLKETAAAYEYLINEEHVSPEKILIAGDSAGGHLALSFLVDLANERSSSGNALPKPSGLALLSPWLSLHNELPSFKANAQKDVLSAPFLRRVARQFLGHDVAAQDNPLRSRLNSPYLEFLTPEPAIEWDTVLPSWVWVSAGTDEMFFDNVKTWVGMLEDRLSQERVTLAVGPKKVHVWQWLETIMDEGMKKDFLGRDVGDGKGFEATAAAGRVIARQVREHGLPDPR